MAVLSGGSEHLLLWIFKTGAPWRDLPERYGHWKNVHRRFSRWSKAGIFDEIFRILSEDADMEFLLMDGTIVKAHQHASGAKKKKIQSTTTKLSAAPGVV